MKVDFRITTLETEDVLPECEHPGCKNEARHGLAVKETVSRRYITETYLCLDHLQKLGTGIGVFVLRQHAKGRT